jgi:hypothetical protein
MAAGLNVAALTFSAAACIPDVTATELTDLMPAAVSASERALVSARTRLATRSGADSAIVWATIPPIDMPATGAREIPSADITASTSSA